MYKLEGRVFDFLFKWLPMVPKEIISQKAVLKVSKALQGGEYPTGEAF